MDIDWANLIVDGAIIGFLTPVTIGLINRSKRIEAKTNAIDDTINHRPTKLRQDIDRMDKKFDRMSDDIRGIRDDMRRLVDSDLQIREQLNHKKDK